MSLPPPPWPDADPGRPSSDPTAPADHGYDALAAVAPPTEPVPVAPFPRPDGPTTPPVPPPAPPPPGAPAPTPYDPYQPHPQNPYGTAYPSYAPPPAYPPQHQNPYAAGPYGQAPGYPYAMPGTPQKSPAMAIIALVLAVFAWPVGLVLALVSLLTRRPAKGLAVGAVVVSALMAWLTWAVVNSDAFKEGWAEGEKSSTPSASSTPSPDPTDPAADLPPVTRNAAGQITAKGALDPQRMHVGDCYQDPGSESVYSVIGVPCAASHDLEIYAIERATDAKFPGDSAMDDRAQKICDAKFAAFVGIPIADSELWDSWWYPSADTWSTGDRMIACSVGGDSQTTGTLKGAKR